MSMITPELLAAYQKTQFRVGPPANFTLRVGHRSEPAARLLESRGALGAAFITACNPYSQTHADAWNREAHDRLLAQVAGLGFDGIEGEGVDPDGAWPSERSLLVVGLAREVAARLGREHGQNAIVWVTHSGDVQLYVLTPTAE